MSKIIGIKGGCYTLLTAGHVHTFEMCKNHVDHLIVLTSDDQYINKKKKCVPLPVEERMEVLQSIKYVDEVDFYKEQTENNWIRNFKKHEMKKRFGNDCKLIVFHSQERKLEKEQDDSAYLPGEDSADEIIFIDNLERTSVTQMFNRIVRSSSRNKNEQTKT